MDRKERQRQASRRWWEKLKADPERHQAYLAKKAKESKKYYDANREEINRREREKNSSPEIRAQNAAWQREYRKNNKKHVADRDAAREFGIPIEEVQRLRSITHCEICGDELQHYTKNGSAIDHCHTKGHVRGMLCGRCNRALGLLRDDPSILSKAISYLEERS